LQNISPIELQQSQVLVIFFNEFFGNPPTLPIMTEGADVIYRFNSTAIYTADSSTEVPDVIYDLDPTAIDTANALIFHIPDLIALPLWKPPRQLWIAWSGESASNYSKIVDPDFMSKMDVEMSYRQEADIWRPYFASYPAEDFLDRLHQAPRPKNRDRLIASFISSPVNQSGRLEYLQELSRYLSVHHYGQFEKNRELLNDRGLASKLEVIADYKFTIAFENSIDKDYVTEKLFDSFWAGSVPVYLGAPNVDEFLPGDHCLINVNDFSSAKDLADYLLYHQENEAAYQSYFAWKQYLLRPQFLTLFRRYVQESKASYLSRFIVERLQAL